MDSLGPRAAARLAFAQHHRKCGLVGSLVSGVVLSAGVRVGHILRDCALRERPPCASGPILLDLSDGNVGGLCLVSLLPFAAAATAVSWIRCAECHYLAAPLQSLDSGTGDHPCERLPKRARVIRVRGGMGHVPIDARPEAVWLGSAGLCVERIPGD